MNTETNNRGFIHPYLNKKVNPKIKQFYGNSGVYIIKKRGGKKFLYIGFSGSNLYKTLLRHFQSWNDPTQKRVVFKKSGYVVKVFSTTAKRAKVWETFLVNKYKPSKNDLFLDTYTESEQKIFKKHQQELEEQFGKISPSEVPF
jgi:hypothetical protein